MKQLVLRIVPALICGIVLTSCSTDNLTDDHEIEGVYVGSYTTTNLTRDFSWNTTPTIELKGGKYTYEETFEGSFYMNVSGNYSISNDKIIFELTNLDMPMVNFVVVEGFAILLLEGEYNYTFDGEKLIFSKVVISSPEEYSCEFELYKQ